MFASKCWVALDIKKEGFISVGFFSNSLIIWRLWIQPSHKALAFSTDNWCGPPSLIVCSQGDEYHTWTKYLLTYLLTSNPIIMAYSIKILHLVYLLSQTLLFWLYLLYLSLLNTFPLILIPEGGAKVNAIIYSQGLSFSPLRSCIYSSLHATIWGHFINTQFPVEMCLFYFHRLRSAQYFYKNSGLLLYSLHEKKEGLSS